jgi:hypothetical protein
MARFRPGGLRRSGGPIRHARCAVFVGALFLAPAGAATLGAQSPSTENTVRLDSGRASPPTGIEAFSFLEGRWEGQGLGGRVDEVWSAPAAGTMAGAFRLIQDGRVVFYEFLALEEEDDTVVFRLKHFNPGPGLPGWEERDADTTFRLVRIEPGAAWFSGLTLRLAEPDSLVIHLAIRSPDGTVREEAFHLRRMGR